MDKTYELDDHFVVDHFYNYNKYFSLVFQCSKQFYNIDVGAYASAVSKKSAFYKLTLIKWQLNMSPKCQTSTFGLKSISYMLEILKVAGLATAIWKTNASLSYKCEYPPNNKYRLSRVTDALYVILTIKTDLM